MTTYVWVNPERSNSAVQMGIDFIVELSPYDMPTAITGNYDEKAGKFEITFEYIDKEPERLASGDDNPVRVYDGRHSGKLLRISIPIDEAPLDEASVIQLQTRVIKALEDVEAKEARGKRNRDVTKRLLESEFKKVTAELVSS